MYCFSRVCIVNSSGKLFILPIYLALLRPQFFRLAEMTDIQFVSFRHRPKQVYRLCRVQLLYDKNVRTDAVTRIRTWVVAVTTRSTNHYTITAMPAELSSIYRNWTIKHNILAYSYNEYLIYRVHLSRK